MVGVGLSPTSDKSSIRYVFLPHEGAFFDLADLDRDDYTSNSSSNNKENIKESQTKSQELCTTTELVSTVTRIWDSATRPLALFQRKKASKFDSAYFQKGKNVICCPNGDEIATPSVSDKGHFQAADLESPKVTQNPTVFEPYSSTCTYSPIWRCLKGSSVTSIQSLGVNGLTSREISSDFRDVYAWMIGQTSSQIADKKIDDCVIIQDDSQPVSMEIDTHESQNNQELGFSTKDKSHSVLARQEHALAGAFAGIFVSICLHPVDTIKTVIQSCQSDQKSIQHISRSLISERGVTGLYRGIASNIASSAPISAIYTCTYESVKGALLPLFPREYYSLAHCIAGGCASIATSFVFTPSECIKQQMQVHSHYQNSWSALIGIVKKGGFSSLYAGWGAVLCRNVPHSIIKFYTYESLKELMLTSFPSTPQPNTLVTLFCGGLAGSTAALFTTPFDVVKTRLQTQIPGSVFQYHGVFSTLKEIAKIEGLNGLYRGLAPRLVMYMTQGALFFASYESCKTLFGTESANNIDQQKIEEEWKSTE